LKRSLYLAGIVALGFASLLLWRTAHFVRTAEMEMKSRSAQLESVLNHADEAAQESVHVSRDTRINLVHFDRNQQKIAAELSMMVARMDTNLNDALLPQATRAVVQLNAAAQSLTLRANDLAPILAHADEAVLHVDNLAASPEIHEALRSTAAFAKHADGTTENVEAISQECGTPSTRCATRPSARAAKKFWISFST
jgi:type II secretory pathway component GspD/PulD (secretin)